MLPRAEVSGPAPVCQDGREWNGFIAISQGVGATPGLALGRFDCFSVPQRAEKLWLHKGGLSNLLSPTVVSRKPGAAKNRPLEGSSRVTEILQRENSTGCWQYFCLAPISLPRLEGQPGLSQLPTS